MYQTRHKQMMTGEQLSGAAVLLVYVLTSGPACAGDWTGQSLSRGAALYAVAGQGGGSVLAAGNGGVILRLDGGSWKSLSTGTKGNLSGIWKGPENDAFVVGADGLILHSRGNTWTGWTAMASGAANNLSGIWGSSVNDVFAVGGGGSILHYDGGSWRGMPSGTSEFLSAVWGTSGSDVFAVGTEGTVLHYNGDIWTRMASGTRKHLYGVWGTSASDVYAVGIDGTILHYNGSVWSPIASGTTIDLYGVWGSSGRDVFAVGSSGTILHYDGNIWAATPTAARNNLHAVWGISDHDVFSVGDGGLILHYDGSAWSSMPSSMENTVPRRIRPGPSSPAHWYLGLGFFVFAPDGSDYQVGYRPDQSHWLYGYKFTRWTDTETDPFTGRNLKRLTETKTGPLVCYLFDIESGSTPFVGISLLRWSRNETFLVTGESGTDSTRALFLGGGYTGRIGSFGYYNLGLFLAPGARLSTYTSDSSTEDRGGFDVQLQLGFGF